MLQELARETGAGVWAVASMLFFLAIWIAVALKVWRTPAERFAEQAALPLADDGGNAPELPRGESPGA